MSSIAEQYTNEVYRALEYWATWLPGATVRLGECGRIDGRKFVAERNLQQFGIDTKHLSGRSADVQYASQGHVDIKFQLAGRAQTIPNVPSGKAGIRVGFRRSHAILLSAKGVVVHRIDDVYQLHATLADRIAGGDFPLDYAVVTEVVAADAATILISSGSDSEVVLAADGDVTLATQDLARIDVGLSRVVSKGMGIDIVAAEGLTPLFKLVGMKRHGMFPWRPSTVGPLRFEGTDGIEVGELAPEAVLAAG